MKKLLLCLVIVISLCMFTSCVITNEEPEKDILTMIMPTGTPALGVSEYVYNNELVKAEIVAGSDPLVAAFSKKSHDVIIAPINLGAKMYQTYQDYILYKTFVWGNLYLASKSPINSFNDLDGRTVYAFGKNSTPDIVMQALLKNNPNVNVKLEYANDVSDANTLLMSGKAEVIVSAEPSLSKLKSKLDLYTLDLQAEWSKMTANASYPQAGIFVKKDVVKFKYVKDALTNMKASINNAMVNPSVCASAAVNLHKSFETLGVETLTAAIPNCHYQLLESDKEAVLYYLQMMLDLGFGKQMGNQLPDEAFFY